MILTLTFNPTIDTASETNAVRPTRKIRTVDESFHPGGGGINVARVINTLGGNVRALYACGGAMGQLLTNLLQNEGLNSDIISIDGNTRINSIVHERSTGMEYRFIAQGPEMKQTEWQKILNQCAETDFNWLVVSGSLPRGVPVTIYDQLINIAKEKNAKIAIDTSDEALKHVMKYGGATLIKPSQGEFEACTGKIYQSADEIAQSAQSLVKRGISEIIAVTLGYQGAILATKDLTLYLAAPHVRVISASGAGDSFLGGMVFALENGWDPEQAFRLALACGTAAVAEKGTELSQVNLIRRLFKELTLQNTTHQSIAIIAEGDGG